jgi:nucleoside-diphosphate-sugar epimerase
VRVLVTGGNGFIGSAVVHELIKRHHIPIIFDHQRHPTGAAITVHPRTIGEARSHDGGGRGDQVVAERIHGDVRNQGLVAETVSLTDAVVHLAAKLGTQETIADPRPALTTNVIGSLNVFEAVAVRQVPAVYVAVGNHWMNNPYSISKTCAERLALMFNAERGTRIAVVRALNAYGPGQKEAPVRKIIPNFVLPALRGEAVTIYGDGTQVMDMIHVRDVATILVDAMLLDHGAFDRAFEAGTGRHTTVNEVAGMVIAAVGAGRIQHVPMRPGETPHSTVVAHPETLAPLGWDSERMISLEDGLPETVAYYAARLGLTREPAEAGLRV